VATGGDHLRWRRWEKKLIFRLFLLSAVAGVAAGSCGSRDACRRRLIWMANGVSALLFAAVHLPSWGGALSFGLALTVNHAQCRRRNCPGIYVREPRHRGRDLDARGS
jgi:hypothetical protein